MIVRSCEPSPRSGTVDLVFWRSADSKNSHSATASFEEVLCRVDRLFPHGMICAPRRAKKSGRGTCRVRGFAAALLHLPFGRGLPRWDAARPTPAESECAAPSPQHSPGCQTRPLFDAAIETHQRDQGRRAVPRLAVFGARFRPMSGERQEFAAANIFRKCITGRVSLAQRANSYRVVAGDAPCPSYDFPWSRCLAPFLQVSHGGSSWALVERSVGSKIAARLCAAQFWLVRLQSIVIR